LAIETRGINILNWHATIGIAAGILFLAGNIPYILSIRRGETRPNRVSWLVWTTIGFILVGSYYTLGATSTLWLPLCQAIGQAIITCYAFKYCQGKWTKLDKICLTGAGLSLLLWWRSGSAEIALVMNMLMDVLGAIPTIVKMYREPESENRLFWYITSSASFLNVLAIEQFSPSVAALPIYFLALNATMLILLTRSQWLPLIR
jgi:hypothetical protein